MAYRIEKIATKKQISQFHDLPFTIYRHYPNWVPPFRFEIENIFNPEKNQLFRTGECERFLVFEDNQLVGRFALMNHPDRDLIHGERIGGLGFIEMRNDQGVADEIIRFSGEWHKKRGYRAFRGPVNFGENMNYWGLLIENFEEPPVYGMYYHPPYYQELLENTDAEKLDDHWSYKRSFRIPIPERMIRITDRIGNRPDISVRPIDMRNLERDAEYIRQIYNQAWSEQDISEREQEFTELSKEDVRQMVAQLKRIMIPESIVITFIGDEPASFTLSIPDLNEVSAVTKGYMKWWHTFRFLQIRKKTRGLRTMVYGTLPKYRKMGIEALTFVRGIQLTKEAVPQIEHLEGGWVSEKNWLMQRSLEALGCSHHKTHRTYLWRTE